MLQQIEFFIFINHFFGKTKTIQWFTTQAKNSLRFYISCLSDGTAGTVAFGNKNGRLILFGKIFFLAFGWQFITQMNSTVTKLFIMKISFLRSFIRQLFYSR